MAGAVLERELTTARRCRVEFDLAGNADDAGIRRLLRENPIPGRISLSLEREPSYFADTALRGEAKQTIVARDHGQIVCVGSCSIRQRFVNGAPCRVGYLGGLRLDVNTSGRFDILRRGYEFFHELQSADPADFYFTSIASDNQRARGFLERGIRGMPRYEFVGDFVTTLIPTHGNWKGRFRVAAQSCMGTLKRGHQTTRFGVHPSACSLSETEIPQSRANGTLPPDKLILLLNEYNRARQLAPCWETSELSALRQLGLELSDFCSLPDGESRASAAIWDQRKFKQTVIRGYGKGLAQFRPLFNLWARLANQPRLPAIGNVLANAFVSHLALPDSESTLNELIGEVALVAKRRGIELLTLGFSVNDPKLHILRRNFRCREYRSRLYVVRWPDVGGAANELDGRLLAPEIALL